MGDLRQGNWLKDWFIVQVGGVEGRTKTAAVGVERRHEHGKETTEVEFKRTWH